MAPHPPSSPPPKALTSSAPTSPSPPAPPPPSSPAAPPPLSLPAPAKPDPNNKTTTVAGRPNPTATMNTIRSLLIAGRNVPVGGVGDGKWDGNAITSSTARNNFTSNGIESRVLAYALN